MEHEVVAAGIDLKSIDCRLAVIATPERDYPCKIRCQEPGHRDDENSLRVYPGALHCFGCGFHVARRLEALSYLLYGTTAQWPDAIKVAERYVARPVESQPPRRLEPLPSALADVYHTYLVRSRQASMGWLRDRNITGLSTWEFRLGHDGSRFTIPIFSGPCKRLITVRFRRDDRYVLGEDTPKYCGMSGRNGLYLYPKWVIQERKPEVLALVEGELDAVLAWQIGIPAVTTTNGAGNMSKLPAMIWAAFPYVKRLVLIGDMDEPGRAAVEKTYEEAAGGYIVERIRWDVLDGKDITEYCMNNNMQRLMKLWTRAVSS